MIRSGQGLREVSTKDLKTLLRAAHRKEIEFPLTQQGLAIINLLRLGDELGHLRGLDARGVTAVLVAVIAERNNRR
jgi:hypothetical protein